MRRRAFIHAAWLDIRAAFQAFEPRDFLTLLPHGRLQRRDLAE
jgi:hypothetical protein